MPKHLTTNDTASFITAANIGAANGVAGLDVTGKVPAGQLPAAATGSVDSVDGMIGNVDLSTRYVAVDSQVINVKNHGAQGDDTTDDTTAINSAITACPPGGTVYFPPGSYRTSSPIVVPPGKTLMGSHTNHMKVPGLYDPNCCIKPLSIFTGAAAIVFQDQATGGYAAISGEQRILNLMINGSFAPAGVDGIQAKGNIQNVGLRDVTIRDMTGNGIYTGVNAGAYPYSWRMFRVMIDNCHGHGMTVQQMTDLTMVDCQAIGSWANGFVLNNLANSQITSCRSEWNGNHGYYITGNWGTGQGSGGMQMTGCSTDRNGWNGVLVDATGNGPIVISNLQTRRDGRNGGAGGGAYAGLKASATTIPLVIGDWINYPGTDDDGTGTNSPQYGGSFTGNSFVQVDNAYLHANTAGLFDSGTNTVLALGPNIGLATGATTVTTRTLSNSLYKGIPGTKYVVSSTATAQEKARADYVCDGAADNVEIQAAIDAAQAEGGGIIQLSPGTFNLAATLTVNGTAGNENLAKTVTIKGSGQQATKLNVAANTIGITISNWAQIHLDSFGILISGSGIGIKSIGVTSGDTLSFWHSSFKNLRINGGFTATDTSWGMWLEMPWRSVFENIEVEGCRNGIRIVNNSAVQNAGDCTFNRMFVEIVGTGGYGLYFDSIDGNMNQNDWIMFEAGANSTGCTGIYLGGTVGTASQRFIGTNLEQFQTLINVANGESNVFDLNYVTCDTGQAGNKAFVCGANAYNNTFSAKWVNVATGDTLQIIEDSNTTSNCPNIFSGIRIENNTTGTVTYTKSSSTVLRDITTFNTGNAMPAGLLQYPLTTVNDSEFKQTDYGFSAWTADPGAISGSGFQLALGRIYLSKIKVVNRSTVVSNITYYVETAGTALTAGQCLVGLYDASGNRLAVSADQATNLATTGGKTAALTASVTLAVGSYYVAFLANGTGTIPNVAGAGGNSSLANINLTTAASRSLNTGTGNTSLPTTIALGSQTTNFAVRWAALS